jgi:uncharacterized protein YndB with AHSA1/START domain
MNKELRVEKQIVINASPEKIWEALTDKEKIKHYFFGTEAISDWKVGSPLIFQGEFEGKTYQDKGEIVVSEPGKKLQYTYWSGFSGLEDIPENYSLVTYRLEGTDQGTSLSLSQAGFPSEQNREHGESGWTMVLDNLKKLVETDPKAG